MKYTIILYIIILFAITQYTHGQEADRWRGNRPDGHAPIGVMGDHTHAKGEWMFSYRYMLMSMEGMRSGSEEQSSDEVLEDYMVTPTQMPMSMHMLGMMYAPSGKITLMAMANYISSSMDHVTRMGGEFTTSVSSIGDTRLSALVKMLDQNNKVLHLNIGVSIPTGSIEERDVTPASAPDEAQLPYPMQTGSGHFSVQPGVNYLYQWGRISGGSQLRGGFPLHENDRRYKWGNELNINTWIAYVVQKWLSTSLRFSYEHEGEINGRDAAFVNLMMVPTVDPENFGGNILSGAMGANIYVPDGNLKGMRIGLEYALPLVQSLNGTQMNWKGTFVGGIQYAF